MLSPPDPLQLALNTVGSFQCVSTLEQAYLGALAQAGGQMTINLSATEPHTFRPDTGGAVTHRAYSSNRNGFRDFLRDIHPPLEAASLNHFLVLCRMAGIINNWLLSGNIAPRRGWPMLNFQIQAE